MLLSYYGIKGFIDLTILEVEYQAKTVSGKILENVIQDTINVYPGFYVLSSKTKLGPI